MAIQRKKCYNIKAFVTAVYGNIYRPRELMRGIKPALNRYSAASGLLK